MATKNLSEEVKEGDKVMLDVSTDRHGKGVFVTAAEDGEDGPRVRMVHLSCLPSGVPLVKGHQWEGEVTRTEMSNRSIPMKGAVRRVVYVYVTNLKRVEEVKIYLDTRCGKIFRDVVSGGKLVARKSVPVEVRSRRFKFGEDLHDITEATIAGRVVMRSYEKPAGKPCTSFDKLAPVLSMTQFESIGRLYISWANMEALRAQADSAAPVKEDVAPVKEARAA